MLAAVGWQFCDQHLTRLLVGPGSLPPLRKQVVGADQRECGLVRFEECIRWFTKVFLLRMEIQVDAPQSQCWQSCLRLFFRYAGERQGLRSVVWECLGINWQ